MRTPLPPSRPLRVLILALSAGAVVVGVWRGTAWLGTSPRFAIAEVIVTGHHHATREAILGRANVRLGTNIFSASLGDIEARVAEEPWVARVQVARRLPRRILIEVVEHEAATLVLMGGPYLADARGKVFKRASLESGEGKGLLVVSGIPRKAYITRPEAGASAIRRALSTAERWRKQPDRPAIGEVNLSQGGMTLFTLDGGVGLRLGQDLAHDVDGKLERFDLVWAALTEAERLQARMIHLDGGEGNAQSDRVTVRLSAATPTRSEGAPL